MERNKLSLKRNKTFFILIVLLVITQLQVFSQNSINWLDGSIFSSGECLSNQSKFDNLKLQTNPESKLDSIMIYIEVNFKSESFKSIKEFNDFDMEYWLLSNNAFKSESP